MDKQIDMIIDLSWGSCGKGLIAGYLAETKAPDTVVSAWAPNAGHVYINGEGRKWLHTMVPNGIVSPNLKRIMIGPGSLIDPINFMAELEASNDLIGGTAIYIHPHAAVVLERHREEEAGPMTKIGSTKKGVGAAAIERIRRDPTNNNIACNALKGTPLAEYVTTVEGYNAAFDQAEKIQIEGAQGFGLSMYHGFYPYTTSRDVTPNQVLADCGVPYGLPVNVIGTMRTYPIRVANRYDENGNMIGWSGPHYPDQEELDWQKDLGILPEVTTVTKLQRRVFSFSWMQAQMAIRQCRPNGIFLNFVNYHRDFEETKDLIEGINAISKTYGGHGIRFVGLGATVNDVVEVKDQNGWHNYTGIDRLIEYYND